MIFLTTNLSKIVEDFCCKFKYDLYISEFCIWMKFNRSLSWQRLERIETIYCSGKKDRRKNREIVLAPFGNLPRKLNPGDSLKRIIIRWQKRWCNAPRFFCAHFTSSLFCIFMISSWAVCSKGLGLVACVCLHFCQYCKLREQSIYRDVRASFHFYVTISQGTLNNYFIQTNVIIIIVLLKLSIELKLI